MPIRSRGLTRRGVRPACAGTARAIALAVAGALRPAAPALALDRVPATPAKVVRVDPAALTRVETVETVAPAPALRLVPDGGVREIPVGAPVRVVVRVDRPRVTPGENGVPPPTSLRPPASGSAVQDGRTLEAPLTVPLRVPPPLPAAPPARRDNMLADIAYLDVAQGMATSYPGVMVQDRRGFLWITEWGGGLSRYDGTSFTRFTTKQGLASDNTTSVSADRAGNLWISFSRGGLSRYDGNAVTHYTTKQGLPGDDVGAVVEDRAGRFWIATDHGACRFDGTSFSGYAAVNGLVDGEITSILEARDGTIWFATGSGAFAFDGRSFTRYTAEDGLPGDALTGVAEDADGGIWLSGKGVSRFDGTSFTTYSSAQGLPDDDVAQVMADRRGSLWLATRKGVAQLLRNRDDPTRPIRAFVPLAEEQGLSQDRTSFVLEDRAGLIWIATQGGGLDRYRPGSFRHVTAREGLPDTRVWGIVEAKDGALWLATDKGIARFDGEAFGQLRIASATGRDQVHSVYQDRRGALWIGTARDGVFRYDGSSLTRVAARDGKAPGRVWAFAEDREGRLWIGSASGAVRYDGRTFTRYPDELLGGSPVYDIVDSGDGALWFVRKKGGVSRLEGDTVTVFDETSLGSAEGNVGLRDHEGRVWLGTRAGLAVYDGSGFTRIGEDDGLSNPLVFSLAEDPQGAVWAATEKGLNRIVLPPGGARPTIDTFGREEGLKAPDFNQGTGLFDRQGRGWWGTGKGLSLLPADSAFQAPAGPPRVQLLAVDLRQSPVDYRAVARGDGSGAAPAPSRLAFQSVPPFSNVPMGLDLPSDLADLTFRFSAVDLGIPERIEYQSTLGGEDRDWSPPGRDSRAVFGNVAPGRHVFRARARIGTGPWGPPVELPFRVRPPWWLTDWAKALGLLGGLAAVAGIVKLRVRALEAREAELEDLVAQRTSEIEAAKQQALEASRAKSLFLANMSHELRTPLSAVLGFAQLLDRSADLSDRHHEELSIIQRSGEHLLGLINDVLSLSKIEAGSFTRLDRPFDLHEMLASVHSIVKVRAEAKDLDLAFDVGAEVPRTVSGDEGKLRQVLINLLGNAVKFTERGRVTLRVRWSGGRAAFEVEDTGPGISEDEMAKLFRAFSQTESGLSAKEGTGLGLVISRQIVRLLGGDIGVRSQVGAGTTFSFDVELPSSSEAVAPRRHRRVASLAAGQEPVRVLVADDTLENRLLLTRLLGGAGFDVREAVDGAEAFEEWERWRPHLVFMDVRMPVLNGREATRRIRAREGSKATRIVALTASALEHEQSELLACGVDAVLTKPFAVDDLFAAIAQQTGVRYRYADEVATPGDLPATLPGVNVEGGLRRAGGNPTLYRGLLLRTVSGLGSVLARVEQLTGRGEALAELRQVLHTLKGSAGTLGLERVAEAASSLEASLGRAPAERLDVEPLRAAIEEARGGCEALLRREAEPVDAAGSAPLGPEHASAAMPIVVRLRRHLETSSMDATDDAAALKTALGGALGAPMRDLETSVANLDFTGALERLEGIESRLRAAGGREDRA